jgi:hypothetical protein
MHTEPLSFLSYSRKDYYFAESLAFHLLRRGVPVWLDVRDLEPGKDWEHSLVEALDAATAVVLVASAASVASPHVQNEWQRALRQGKRIVLARLLGARIPAELQRCESVDFRGTFGRALGGLVAKLKSPMATAGTQAVAGGPTSWIGVPPWVALVATTLAVPSLAYLLLGTWALDPSAPLPPLAQWALVPAIAVLVLWFFCITFLRRRMGMTRLALSLVCLTGVFAIPSVLFGLLGEVDSQSYGESMVRMARDHWREGIALAAVPLAGLVVLIFVRPEDLLRWAPTGSAWPVYRVGHVADAAFARADVLTQFSLVGRFFVLHDAPDAPMAERLRQQLAAQGASEVGAGAAGATAVLLLTNRTRTPWLDSQMERLPAALLTIVGTAIRMPDQLERLWRRQWTDFRGWDPRRADRQKSLPQVPETVTQARFPSVVNQVHQALCAVGALLYVLGGKVDRYSGGNGDPSFALIAAALAALWWAWVARQLLRRSRPESTFVRDCQIGWAATAAAVGICGFATVSHQEAIGRVLLVVAASVAAFAWWSWRRKELGFWFPQQRGEREKPGQSLSPGRNWRTLIVFAVYLFAGYLVLEGVT